MRTLGNYALVFIVTIACCVGCQLTPTQQAEFNTGACWTQAAANAAESIGTAEGNAAVAIAGDALSVAAGTLCVPVTAPVQGASL